MLPLNARNNSQGFTLLETLIIVIISGILAALVAPSFLGMTNSGNITNAFNQTSGALQEIQSEAIRRSKKCTLALGTGSQLLLSSNCFRSIDTSIRASAGAAINATSISVNALPIAIPSGTGLVFTGGAVAFVTANAAKGATSLSVSAISGAAIASGDFAPVRILPANVTLATDIDKDNSSQKIATIAFDYKGQATANDNPNVNTGKIVLFTSGGSSTKKCLVVSTPLGLIRTGNYTGTTTPAAINTTNCVIPSRT